MFEKWKKRADKKEARKLLIGFLPTETDRELAYKDRFTTVQQKKRDEKITELLNHYVDAYRYKVKSGKWFRPIIFVLCMAIIAAFAVALVWLVCRVTTTDTAIEISDLVAFVTACITFLALIVELLKIITKYFFPENDEQYITKIVESIQNNDLENKRENARNQEQPAGQEGAASGGSST